jgi:hypothetical protein
VSGRAGAGPPLRDAGMAGRPLTGWQARGAGATGVGVAWRLAVGEAGGARGKDIKEADMNPNEIASLITDDINTNSGLLLNLI